MLPLGLTLPDGSVIASANVEVSHAGGESIGFGPALGGRTEVWLRTERAVHAGAADVRRQGPFAVVTEPTGAPVRVVIEAGDPDPARPT